MSKHGRLPPFAPTEEQRALVEILAGNGIPHAAICKFVKSPVTDEPINISTLKRHFKGELKDGRHVADAGLIKMAYQMAKTNASVLIFMCKTRLGWKEPAQDVNLHTTYGELVKQATEQPKPDLKLVQGSKVA